MIEVLYEDNHIIAVNKHVSDIVQGDKTGDTTLADKVKHYIKEKYNKPGDVYLGIPHRLDRPVSGVVLFARTSKALTRLNAMFASKDFEKIYWAVVKVKPPEQTETLEHFLVRDHQKNKSKAFRREIPNAKQASLTYRQVGQTDNYYFVEIDLHTGRHHQIRAQMSAIGCPIKGDLKYGFARSNPDAGISLHARRITFEHPVSKQALTIVAPPPPNDVLWSEFLKVDAPSQ